MLGKIVPIGLATAVSFTAAGALADSGFYGSLAVGGSLPHDSKNVGNTLNFNTELDPGYAASLAVGYRFGDGWRFEAEATRAQSEVSSIRVKNAGTTGAALGTSSGDGTVSSNMLMVNLIMEFNTRSKWHPYLLGGIGAAHVDMADISVGGVALTDDETTAFAFQAGLGIDYSLDSDWRLGLAYRYFSTSDLNYNDAANVAFESELATHILNVRALRDF